MKLQYTVVIQWSEEDQAYLVTLPEFGPEPQTHGSTYKEAVKHAQEVMETLIDFYRDQGRALPKPKKFSLRKTKRKLSKKQKVA